LSRGKKCMRACGDLDGMEGSVEVASTTRARLVRVGIAMGGSRGITMLLTPSSPIKCAAEQISRLCEVLDPLHICNDFIARRRMEC